jgi:hypothetical protein
MKLPKTLYVGYNLLKKSRVVVKKAVDAEALGYFKHVLNEAHPKQPDELLLFKFVKNMYNSNKKKFLSFIKGTQYECLVLWTESKTITDCLGLRNIVYVKWCGDTQTYDITMFKRGIKKDASPNEHPLVEQKESTEDTSPNEHPLVEQKESTEDTSTEDASPNEHPLVEQKESTEQKTLVPTKEYQEVLWGDLEEDDEDE